MSYGADRSWSDRYIDEIKRIVGPHLLSESTFEVDTQEATDLVVLNTSIKKIACRMRRPGVKAEWLDEFTIRYKRDNGCITEYDKIMQGYADWMFYGHAVDDTSTNIEPWHLLDLDVFRYHIRRRTSCITCGNKPNGDGTHFLWFKINSFPLWPQFVIAQSKGCLIGNDCPF